MKKNKIITSFVLLSLLIPITCSNVNASSAVIQPRGPICTPTKYYEPSSTKNDIIINKQGEFKNNGSQVQSKTISYSTTYKTETSVSTTAEFNLITAKLGATAKVGVGKSSTITTSSTFKISPHCIGYYKVGQKKKNTSGYIVTVYDNCTYKEKYVTAKYSYTLYDEYSEKKI